MPIIPCNKCQRTGKIIKMGGIEQDCDSICCRVNRLVKKAVIRINILGKHLREHHLFCALLLFFVAFSVALLKNHVPEWTAAGTTIIILFTSLKYKLDQANYHKDLFEKRYEIFTIINNILWAWASEFEATEEMVNELNKIMRRSYYLFGDTTYQFIKLFRQSIINLAYTKKNQQDISDPKINEARTFLVNLLDNEKLPQMFRELKIDSYI